MIKELDELIDNNLFSSNIINLEDIYKEKEVNPFAKYIFLLKNDLIIGYLYYSDIYDRIEINQIEIENIHRNCGNGTKLMKYLVDNNDKDITLEVNKKNENAIKLYKKFNFESVAIRKSYYNGIDGILMERKKDSY